MASRGAQHGNLWPVCEGSFSFLRSSQIPSSRLYLLPKTKGNLQGTSNREDGGATTSPLQRPGQGPGPPLAGCERLRYASGAFVPLASVPGTFSRVHFLFRKGNLSQRTDGAHVPLRASCGGCCRPRPRERMES